MRYFEKVRDQWRRRRTIVRFVTLAVQRGHDRRIAEDSQDDGRDRRPTAPKAKKQAV